MIQETEIFGVNPHPMKVFTVPIPSRLPGIYIGTPGERGFCIM